MKRIFLAILFIPAICFSQTRNELVTMMRDSTITASNAAAIKNTLGLNNVSNTSDVNKPVSPAIQTALDAKQNSLGFTPYNATNPNGYISSFTEADPLALKIANNFSDINNATTARSNLGLIIGTNVLAPSGDGSGLVGLLASQITATANKNFVTDAQQTVIGNTSGTNTGDNAVNSLYSGLASSKENAITAGTTAQYWRGDKSFQTLDKNAVGLANVDNTSDANKPVSTAQQTALDLKANINNASFTGTFATAAGAIGNASLANTAVANLSGTNTGDNAVNSLYSGLVSNATHTGDATGSTALTVVRINGVSMAGLTTGILKNTTGTGAPSIAVAGDFPVLNQNTTGSAGTVSGTNVVTNTNLSQMAANTFKANNTASTANATDITTAQAKAMIETEDASIVAATAAINTTETIVVKTPAMAANRMVAGSTIRITLVGTNTSSAANTSTFRLRLGTAGTTADALLATVTTATAATTGTAVPFRVVIDLTIRTTTTAFATVTVFNTGGTSTGISTVPVQVLLHTMSALNTATAAQILSATYLSAATTTTSTFQMGFIDFLYK